MAKYDVDKEHVKNDKAWAFRRMGRVYLIAEFGHKPNMKKAFKLNQRAAEMGDMYIFALLYQLGDVVQVDMPKATYWYQQLDFHGHAMGQYRWSKIKLDGKSRVLDPSES